MADMNIVFLLGNLTRDPETRTLPSGGTVCTFTLAVNRRFSTSQGEDREETCFVDIETWGRQAETCARYLRRGAPAMVEGRLRQDRWEDRETGAPRTRILVVARRVQFLGAPGDSGRERQTASQPPAGQARQPARADAPPMPDFEPVEAGDDDIPF
jgi:single-strand DNA-binding protein